MGGAAVQIEAMGKRAGDIAEAVNKTVGDLVAEIVKLGSGGGEGSTRFLQDFCVGMKYVGWRSLGKAADGERNGRTKRHCFPTDWLATLGIND